MPPQKHWQNWRANHAAPRALPFDRCAQPKTGHQPPGAVPVIVQAGLRCGGYANGFTSIEKLAPGTTVDNLQARVDLNPEKYAEHALGWAAAGATIIGGCCEISPQHIATLGEMLVDKGYELDSLV